MPYIIIAQYVIVAVAWLWGFWAAEYVTNAGIDFLGLLVVMFFGGVIGVAWSCCYAAAVFAPIRGRRFRRMFWSAPVIGVSALALSFNGTGFKVRLWLCESVLRERAEALRQKPKPGERRPDRQIGLFEVQYVFAEADQVTFQTGTGFLRDYGIVYRPDGARPVKHHQAPGSCWYEHLYGPWWRYEDSWD